MATTEWSIMWTLKDTTKVDNRRKGRYRNKNNLTNMKAKLNKLKMNMKSTGRIININHYRSLGGKKTKILLKKQ